MLTQRQSGFTLVELMVALAVGSIIILGAGSLFLTTFQTFQKVEELSRKQEVLVFATSTLVRDIRSATSGSIVGTDGLSGNVKLELSVVSQSDGYCPNGELLDKRYSLAAASNSAGNDYSLRLSRKCDTDTDWGNPEPLVEGFYDDSSSSFDVSNESNGLYRLNIRLAAENSTGYEEFVFRVQNRANAI